jgi:phosphopantetheinyl transferase (holo-ACP synthase)
MTIGMHRVLVTEARDPGARDTDSHGTLVEAVRQLFDPMDAPPVTAADVVLSHTPLGQPVASLCGPLARWAGDHAILPHEFHLSFSHDGEALVALLVTAPGLRGAGVDLVYLPRLARRPTSHLLALAKRFMSPAEHAAFVAAAMGCDHAALVQRVASHFSLMEAASKALGTGLRLGFGNGTRQSLLPSEIAVTALAPEIVFDFGSAAQARCDFLGAARAEGQVALDEEYLRSEVYLWRNLAPARHVEVL